LKLTTPSSVDTKFATTYGRSSRKAKIAVVLPPEIFRQNVFGELRLAIIEAGD
jgi:hypothetical protein